MKKGKRRRGNETNKFMEDRISQMPDEILVSILSLLTMKEAAWTSILSRRWKNMWTFITSSLEFDWSAVVLKLELLDVARKNFVRWVNRVLESHQALIINEFRVGFDLDGINSKCDIDRWINFALGKGVKRLELNLASFWGNSPEGRYAFPSHSLNVSSFNSLTSLSLTYVDVSGEVLESFLFNCPFLEGLYVGHSYGLVNLKVYGLSLRLKYLEICHCNNLKNLEISSMNLMLFKYFGPVISMPLRNVPCLNTVSFGGYIL